MCGAVKGGEDGTSRVESRWNGGDEEPSSFKERMAQFADD